MENTIHCPILEDCTIYLNNTCHNEMVGLTYRRLYCLQVNKKYKMCKRYHAFQKLGKPAPRYILPNSVVSIEEIAGSGGSN
jgi:hypothetical protein